METVQPMLGDLELQQVQEIETDGDQVILRHRVPGLEGDFLQGLGRRGGRITVAGVLTGPEAGEGLAALRERFRAAQPVSFVSDIATATRVDEVLVEEMEVRELAGKPERFEYHLVLREYTEPEPVTTEPPPEIPPPPLPETATLIVEVIVEGEPGFDMERVTVTVRGTTAEGDDLVRVLEDRTGNFWTGEDFPPGDYTVEAVVADDAQLTGSEPARVRPGETTQVTITLRRGAAVAEAFVVHFRFDTAFVEPCMRPVLREIVAHADAHPEQKMVVVGHTDKVGSASYNQSLSERRARAVYAYLVSGRDRETAVAEWDELRKRRPSGQLPSLHDTWGVWQYQHMLQDLGYYVGNIDERHGPGTDDAVRSFQQDRALPATGSVDGATWRALVEDYLDLEPQAVAEDRFLPNAGEGCEGGVVKWLGCGEQDPVRNTEDAWRPNRRTEVLFVRAEGFPCQVPEPVTFALGSEGARNPRWCLGPGNPARRCCFLIRDGEDEERWKVQPARPEQITVHGRIRFEDGSPVPFARYALAAPDGEYLHTDEAGTPDLGERPAGTDRGRPIPDRADEEGFFTYPEPTGVGTYVLELFDLEPPQVARRGDQAADEATGNVVCVGLSGSDAAEIVVQRQGRVTSPRVLRATLFDRYGEPRRRIAVDLRFDDGTAIETETDDEGRFTVTMSEPHEVGRIRYTVREEDPPEEVLYEEFFVDVKGIHTAEGVRRRLHNLGYLEGVSLEEAVTAFQATHGLDTTGEVDDPTRDKLLSVHDGADEVVPELEEDEGALTGLHGAGPPPE